MAILNFYEINQNKKFFGHCQGFYSISFESFYRKDLFNIWYGPEYHWLKSQEVTLQKSIIWFGLIAKRGWGGWIWPPPPEVVYKLKPKNILLFEEKNSHYFYVL